MSKKINRFGLKRIIPPAVRAQIRKEAGYGCVFCGNPFVDYEHIDPEFKDAKIHDPDKMTLLCSGCHDNVTQRRWSKKRVWAAKAEPFAKKEGFIRNSLSPSQDKAVIKMGNMHCSLANIVLSLYGKPIIWFEPSNQPDAPIFLNAIFHDNGSKPIAYVSRNVFRGIVGEHDIVSTAARFEIRAKPRTISLIIESVGDEPIEIKRLCMEYLGQEVSVNSKAGIRLKGNGSDIVFNGGSISGFNSGFSIGGVPSSRRDQQGVMKKITLAMEIQSRGLGVISFNGSRIAWKLGNLILSKSYEFVGVISDKQEVSSITGEYIGQLNITSYGGKSNAAIEVSDDEYPSGEPIWVSPVERKVKNVMASGNFDVGHRFNPGATCYAGDVSLGAYVVSDAPDRGDESVEGKPKAINVERQLSAVDGPIVLGDKVTVDFVGELNGVPFEGGTATGFDLVIGSGRMIPGFEEGVIGARQGDDIRIPIQFPEDYHAESLRGQFVVFDVRIIEILRPLSP
ncbi:HNH endonuclease [Shewanella aquimarina]|uniref:HNH endonuclease signature motif containing protein n=1 Tax=Shewanella aquimarina TaxID=260365 RepID=UPI002014904E|nr:HNH endonuclease [Shewanella aquimarina]MCL2908545.1 FKBP-type peptidyl-prolyl cis-trans isomerase [Shewanella aquimarina]